MLPSLSHLQHTPCPLNLMEPLAICNINLFLSQGKWDVPLPKVKAVGEDEVFKVIKTGRSKSKFSMFSILLLLRPLKSLPFDRTKVPTNKIQLCFYLYGV